MAEYSGNIFCHYSPRLRRIIVLVYTQEVISTMSTDLKPNYDAEANNFEDEANNSANGQRGHST